MKTIRRYIFWEIVGPFFLGVLIFSFVLLIGIIGQPSSRNPLQLLAQKSVTLFETLLIFIYLVPRILTLSLPMAVLLAVLVGFGRLSSDSEIIAMRSTGIGTLNFSRPVFLFALGVWLIALFNSLFWYPHSLQLMRKLVTSVALRSISTEVREGVFEEGFSNLVIYVRKTSLNRAVWNSIFVADLSNKDQLKVTLANGGNLVSDPVDRKLQLHLSSGAHHLVDNHHPEVYQVMPFDQIDVPVASLNLPAMNSPPKISLEELRPQDLLRVPLPEGSRLPPSPKDTRDRLIELNVRLALPFSVLIFALIGLPLGVFSKRGGKSYSFIISLAVFIVYYLLFLQGSKFARSGRLNPVIGPWLPNLVFLGIGIYLLSISERTIRWSKRLQIWNDRAYLILENFQEKTFWKALSRLVGILRFEQRKIRMALPMILDRYVVKGLLRYFFLVLFAFVSIFIIFTFFELLNDLVENHVPAIVVLSYFWYLLPQVLFYMFPLSLLVAVLVNFNILTRTSQVTAMKASGISIYRLSASVIILALLLCGISLVFQEFLLPSCNQKQDYLRAVIKGRSARTFYHPGRKWIMGENSTIINYKFFDEDRNLFGDLSIFEFDPSNFQLIRRVYASRAVWRLTDKSWELLDGWSQHFQGNRTIPGQYFRFQRTVLPEMTELPSYFKKEVKLDSQMTFQELSAYIRDLKRSGFDVTKLEVALQKKLSFPLINLIMCLLAIPFAFSTGRHGSLYGVGLSILLGIVYWVMVGFFEQIGGVGKLVPELAAWAPNLIFGAAGSFLIFNLET